MTTRLPSVSVNLLAICLGTLQAADTTAVPFQEISIAAAASSELPA